MRSISCARKLLHKFQCARAYANRKHAFDKAFHLARNIAIKRAILQNVAENRLHCTKPRPHLPLGDKRRTKKVREIQESASSSDDGEFFLRSVEITAPRPPKVDTISDSAAQADQNPTVDNWPALYQWEINLSTNSINVTCKIDIGAQANVLPVSNYNSLLKQPKFCKSKARLTANNCSPIAVAGKRTAFIPY